MTSSNINTTHAFTTRFGGVSEGIYASMNLGLNLGDDITMVERNYNILCQNIGIESESIVASRQVHGTNIRVVTHKERGQLFSTERLEADGMITNDPTITLMVYAGDCVPILFHDPIRNVVCAVHAGWRGTVADIAGTAVRKMQSDFASHPSDIHVAIGPCISQCCFETQSDVAYGLLEALGPDALACISRRGPKFKIDLKEANRLFLTRAGISEIAISDECTCCSYNKYWSHRKTKGRRGSQVALIAPHLKKGL